MTAPTDHASLLEQAIALHNAGNLAGAEGIYRQIVSRDPNNTDAVYLLGVIAGQSGHYDAAEQLICRAIAAKPRIPLYVQGLAETYRRWGKFVEATAAAQRAVALEPNSAMALERLAQIQKEARRLEDAMVTLNRLIKIAPDSADAYNNLGGCLIELRREPEAIAILQKAAQINPDSPEAHNNLGASLLNLSRPSEAIAEFQTSLRLKPNNVEALCNMGAALQDMNRVAEAIAVFRRAVTLNPDFANAHYNLALALLLNGQLGEGWAEHEWRWRSKLYLQRRHPFDKPQWDGSDPNGRTLLIHSEQGYGDVIQLVRYVPLLAARGAKIILATAPELYDLLKTVKGDPNMMCSGVMPAHDFNCPTMTLPLFFSPNEKSIPADIPYLWADPAKVEWWEKLIVPRSEGLRVGVVWAGRPEHPNDHNRSMAVERLAPLAEVPGVIFYSLQKRGANAGPLNPPAGLNLIDLTQHLSDFSQTAALIANLDLVISVDTAVAHVAGAIGKPTWILLPFVPDWRWMLDREDSPWYSNVRLFRQAKPGDWENPVSRIKQSLSNLVAKSDRI